MLETIFTFIDILYILFSDFRFSDITAVMHSMPSIGLEENLKQKISTHFIHKSAGHGSFVLQY